MLNDLLYRLRALLRRRDLDRDLDAELEFHIEQEIAKRVRAGMTREAAERAARMEFGGLEQVRENTRDSRGINALDSLLRDFRYAWRGVRSRPGFSAAVILTLGLGIGANAAMFGVVDRLLLRPPAFMTDGDRVHRLYLRYTWESSVREDSYFEYRFFSDMRTGVRNWDAVAAAAYRNLPIGAGRDARELQVATVSGTFFDLFEARPVLGRFFNASDDVAPTGQNVVVLSHAYWQSAYGGRRDVLGERIRIGNATYAVVGVAPPGFTGRNTGAPPIAFVPITAFAYSREPSYSTEYGWSFFEILARRAPGVSEAAAAADMTRAMQQAWQRQHEVTGWLTTLTEARPGALLAPVQPARGPDAGPQARVAVWVLGVAFVVLLIAAANVVNLMLTRAAGRGREISLRLAIGGSRSRIVQQLSIETLTLALLGGVAGLATAKWGGALLRVLFMPDDAAATVATDSRTLLFTALLTIMVALLTGIAPAVHALRSDLARTLTGGARQTDRSSSVLRTSLLMFQAGLCVVLLIGAGLFVKSLNHVRDYRMGYDHETLIVADVNNRGVELDEAGINALAERLRTAAAEVPGVASATLTASVPFYSSEGRGAPRVAGRDSLHLLGRYVLQTGSLDYFQTLGTRILRGRGFNAEDMGGGPNVVVIGQAMANAIWPGEDVLGKQLRIGSDTAPMLTVVGVAEDVVTRSVGADPELWYYLPVTQYRTQFGATRPMLMVRVQGSPENVVEPLRERLQREMPGDAYVNARAYSTLVRAQQQSWRAAATMFLAFGMLALVLAAIGLYSVIAYAVVQRTRELGVRIALGASVGNVLRLVTRHGVAFASAGILAGSTVAWYGGRFLEPLLFQVSPTDPIVYGGVALVLVAVAVAACIRPALRATRVNPTIALRAE